MTDSYTKKQTVSYSKLNTYRECPQKYAHKYVYKTPYANNLKDYFILGTLAHSLIESVLLGEEIDNALTDILAIWLDKSCSLYKPNSNICIDVQDIEDYAIAAAEILHKATAEYTGDDAIRTQKGEIPIAPKMTSGYKKMLKDSGLATIQYSIDQTAAMLNSDFEKYSLAEIVADAYFLAKNFKMPLWVEETIAVEYRFEDQDNQLEWSNGDIFWLGGIDWVCKTINDETVIIDHKTSKKAPSLTDILWHPQLNMYCYLYHSQTGILPDYIGINHLLSGKVLLAKLDVGIMATIVAYYEGIQDKIEMDSIKTKYTKRLPTDYNTPCISRDFGGPVKGFCEFIESCWGNYYIDLLALEEKQVIS